MLRDLLHREIAGLRVTLFWEDDSKTDPRIPPLVVGVHAGGMPSFFATADNAADALEIYHHPYATLNRLLKAGRVAK